MAGKIGLRFDVDSIKDASEGIKNLIDAKQKYGESFSFSIFANMGRGINRKIVFSDLKTTRKRVNTRGLGKVSITKKLGAKDLLKTLILNPFIGKTGKKYFLEAKDLGCEIGLHGGMDHTLWQRKGKSFTYEDTKKLLMPALREFKLSFGHPEGFTAPGFVQPEELERILKENGFLYHCDIADSNSMKIDFSGFLPNIPVNIIGLNTIPIISYLYSNKYSKDDTVNYVEKTVKTILKDFDGTPVIYGHPSVELLLFRSIFEAIVENLLNKGYIFVSLKDLINEEKKKSACNK
jgi:hypothetical protein